MKRRNYFHINELLAHLIAFLDVIFMRVLRFIPEFTPKNKRVADCMIYRRLDKNNQSQLGSIEQIKQTLHNQSIIYVLKYFLINKNRRQINKSDSFLSGELLSSD
jgi:hypothetical protein